MDYLGAHMSISGGLHLTAERGIKAGCGVIQIFTQNASQWRGKMPADSDAALFRDAFAQSGLLEVISHDIYLINLAARRLSPKQLAREALDFAEQTRYLVQTLPVRADVLLDRLERGKLVIGFDLLRLDQVARRITDVGNRLSFAAVVAALLLSSAVLLSAGPDVAVWRVPLLHVGIPIGALTFVAAGFFGFWLLISIVRSHR